jgi:replicative DNA helicase
MTQLMVDLYKHQEEMKVTGGIGVATGFKSLDRENGGFQNGQLIVIGARPSMGKSALVGGMGIEISKKGLKVGIVSLEMSNTEIAARLAAYDTDTDFNVVYRGLYKDMDETHRLYDKISNSTSTLPIYVSDKTKVNIPEIRAKAEKLKSLHGLDCLFIDYLQLVSAIGGSYSKNRENEIAEMSRGCKIMAKELDIPVVLLCQLNREVTKRKGTERYPQLSDLRESGAIEQDADVVMFLHRDFMAGYETDENGNKTDRQADLVVRKWRNGRSNFIIPLDFDPPKMKFKERETNMLPVLPSSSPYQINYGEKDDAPF